MPHLAVRDFVYATLQSSFVKSAAILYSGLLEEMVTRISDGLPHKRLRASFLLVLLGMLSRLRDDTIRLMAKRSCKFPMLLLHFLGRQQFFPVACGTRRNLGGSRSIHPLLAEMVFDLLSPKAGCLQILTRVVFDFRLAILAALNLIPQLLQSRG